MNVQIQRRAYGYNREHLSTGVKGFASVLLCGRKDGTQMEKDCPLVKRIE